MAQSSNTNTFACWSHTVDAHTVYVGWFMHWHYAYICCLGSRIWRCEMCIMNF